MTRMVEIEIGKVAVIESGEAQDKLQRKYNSNRIK